LACHVQHLAHVLHPAQIAAGFMTTNS
jgi:hypothetical protein